MTPEALLEDRYHTVTPSRYAKLQLQPMDVHSAGDHQMRQPQPRRMHLRFGQLQQSRVLLRMRLLDISLGHLLHHEIAVNLNVFNQLAICYTPFPRNGQRADGGLGIDERVDA
jgi:hypothetical protein